MLTQAAEQCYAYKTRHCIIHGHRGHQLAYLAKPNLLLISIVIPYSAGADGRASVSHALSKSLGITCSRVLL